MLVRLALVFDLDFAPHDLVLLDLLVVVLLLPALFLVFAIFLSLLIMYLASAASHGWSRRELRPCYVLQS